MGTEPKSPTRHRPLGGVDIDNHGTALGRSGLPERPGFRTARSRRSWPPCCSTPRTGVSARTRRTPAADETRKRCGLDGNLKCCLCRIVAAAATMTDTRLSLSVVRVASGSCRSAIAFAWQQRRGARLPRPLLSMQHGRCGGYLAHPRRIPPFVHASERRRVGASDARSGRDAGIRGGAIGCQLAPAWGQCSLMARLARCTTAARPPSREGSPCTRASAGPRAMSTA